MSKFEINYLEASKATSTHLKAETVEKLLKELGIKAVGSHQEKVTTLLRASGLTNQHKLAGLVIKATHAQGNVISPADLTSVLAKAYPGAKIGDRHGPHYLCLARTGKLAEHGCPKLVIAYAERKPKAPAKPQGKDWEETEHVD